MTVEEAIQAATGGDTECMFQLGNYYATQEKKYDEAQEWYLNGAKAGDIRCMALAASMGTILACSKRKVAGGSVAAECIQELKECLSWSKKASANGMENDSTGIEEELGVAYYLAFLHERNTGKTEYLYQAEELLKAHNPSQHAEYRMYLAFTLRDKLRLENGLNREETALLFNLLKDCAMNHRTELAHGDLVCYYLGDAYLKGQICQRDDNLAYQWMSTAQQMGFDCHEMLDCFKKKLFGGYVFQG